jgi:hypothetical protein
LAPAGRFKIDPGYDNARTAAGGIGGVLSVERSGLIGTRGNTRNVGTVETDVGQFAIAELRELGHIALIVTERLDHTDKREQHFQSPSVSDSSFEASSLLK